MTLMTASSIASTAANSTQSPVRFNEALWFWFKLGFISFGGPAGQITLMHQEVVERKHWLHEDEFLHALSFCMVLPGPEAQQLATYLGWKMNGIKGGIAAGVLFILPAFLIITVLAALYLMGQNWQPMHAFLYGVKASIVAIIAVSALRLAPKVLKSPLHIVIAIGTFIATFLQVSFPWVVLVAALLGFFAQKYHPSWLKLGNSPQHTPPTTHTFHPQKILTTSLGLWHVIKPFLYGFLLWLCPLLLLYVVLPAPQNSINMGLFFTKTALVSFGGAYAVLPYVMQYAVTKVHWLTASQMLDGFALGESTPGPLIMVIVFVAFLGGYHEVWLPLHPYWSGALAALIATWYMFLPSFLFILLGAPWVEKTKQNLNWAAPLSCISAAVLAVILQLAVFMVWHVFVPSGKLSGIGSIDWLCIAICMVAFALCYFKSWPTWGVILLSGLVGLLAYYLSY